MNKHALRLCTCDMFLCAVYAVSSDVYFPRSVAPTPREERGIFTILGNIQNALLFTGSRPIHSNVNSTNVPRTFGPRLYHWWLLVANLLLILDFLLKVRIENREDDP